MFMPETFMSPNYAILATVVHRHSTDILPTYVSDTRPDKVHMIHFLYFFLVK